MNKKIIISIVAAVICAAALTAVILINVNQKAEAESQSTIKSSSEILSAGKAEKGDTEAGFAFQYTDRLAGHTATDIKSTDSTIKVTYGNAGYVSKTDSTAENSGAESKDEEIDTDDTEYSESSEQVIDSLKVTFKGNDGTVSFATWKFGSFTYTVSVNSGISAEDMTEYVRATR